jgi:hypothetical protein
MKSEEEVRKLLADIETWLTLCERRGSKLPDFDKGMAFAYRKVLEA